MILFYFCTCNNPLADSVHNGHCCRREGCRKNSRTTSNLEKVEDKIFFQTLNSVSVDCKTLHLEFTIGKGTDEEKKYFAKRSPTKDDSYTKLVST